MSTKGSACLCSVLSGSAVNGSKYSELLKIIIETPRFIFYSFSLERERESLFNITSAHRHNNHINNTHKKTLVAKTREHLGTFWSSSRDAP